MMGKAGECAHGSRVAKTALLCLTLLLFLALPGYAQISFTAHERHEREMRKSLKEAEKADPVYKETHLNTNAYTFRKGAAARKRLKQDERSVYKFNDSGKPMKRAWIFKKRKHKREKRNN